MTDTAAPARETLGFQAEVRQLLDLMIHSLYSNREIFLRELIANASDAADKLRFEALTDASLLADDPDLAIRIDFDRDARTLTISDNGIGMSRDEVVANIGTIARSGTREFLSHLGQDRAKDANLIGQFGVGFYSAFIVADRVTLVTRRAGAPADQAVRWESDGAGEYTIETVSRERRGTDVILHLRKDDTPDDNGVARDEIGEFLNGWKLREVIGRWSDHITLPIYLPTEKWDEDKQGMARTGESEQVNEAQALWTRPKSEITDAQYEAFYGHVAHDHDKPLAWTHAKVEGRQEYTQLLYVPSRAPFDLFDRERRHGVKLYVKRVFIMEDSGDLLPPWLRFVRGVIDSSDLPLNVSREILQQSRDVEAIRAGAVKRVLSLLEDLAENQPAKYTTFWNAFGRVLKEGAAEDFANRERIARLLRFASTHTDAPDQTVTLADYVARMKPAQDRIFYVTAETHAAAKHSPHLEVFRRKGIEVLLLSDRVDEWVVGGLTEFDGKRLASVAKGDLDLGALEDEADKAQQQQAGEALGDLPKRLGDALGEKVKEVRVTHRLTDSPACLVAADAFGMGMNLERMLKAAGQSVPSSKPVLELNPTHPLVLKVRDEPSAERFGELALVLFDQALLAEGGQLEDPATFVKRVNRLMLEMATPPAA
ncbi:MAG: molecular chaperone HtpG [Burkholderiales bacterium]|jgi:molecular chaperone HtpG|nr:molecular chaperone HtpG [Burkholderiales bacterium]